jgi:MerR family transcriptional regulator, light-induced transcriptional regulator
VRQFSIKELEQFSGIKAHTIRTWEQRHSAYLQDLKLILGISMLVNYGYKISKLVALTTGEIEQRVASLNDMDAQRGKFINDLLYCMYATAVDEFDQVIDGAAVLWGLDLTIQQIIIPFLEKVQLLSYGDSSTEAHFVVTAIRRKLIMGIEAINVAAADQRTALLFLPKDEHYDLMLLYIYYTLKKCGLKTLYLGTNISRENLEKACIEKRPDLLFSYTYPKQVFTLQDYNTIIGMHLLETQLYMIYAGGGGSFLSSLPNTQFLHYKELDNLCNLITSPK